MIEEDKELLLKDLSARIPYRVKVSLIGSEYLVLKNIINSSIGWYVDLENAPTDFDIEDIKPYLRPLSSMTEEEDKEWQLYKNNIACACDENLNKRINELYDWFNTHYFDYRGLIEKGLALEAPEGMYNINNK